MKYMIWMQSTLTRPDYTNNLLPEVKYFDYMQEEIGFYFIGLKKKH